MDDETPTEPITSSPRRRRLRRALALAPRVAMVPPL
jgi:hypothetical protein